MTANYNPIMSFGKYRGEPVVEVMARDPAYIDWCMAQENLRERLEPIINIITVSAPSDQDTPEHNLMQAKYFDANTIHKLIINNVQKELWPTGYHHSHNRPFAPPTHIFIEKAGWDIVAEWHNEHRVLATCGIELKPQIGDDYPAVLRQIAKRPRPTLKMCVYQKYNSCVPLTTVSQMFVSSEIHLCGDIYTTPDILSAPLLTR